MTTPPPPVSRVLMAAVIGMGVMIVIGTAGLIGVVVHRAMHPHQAILQERQVSASPMPGQGNIVESGASQKRGDGAAVFTLHGGGHVLSQIVRPDGSLSLLIATPEGEQIVIWSPESNRVMARFALSP
ncbi:hypothetical protein [Asaia bogorensis]|uniref:Uncharacterized protein n=1 Tax=Asaia bogorensis NBRC 16594 TaxID=1231624 RepID=A0AAN4R2B3_9PROT|nr:hypothetical protein [Asaia bogorensis]BAT18911.1 hypothetical protein Asbog_00613 [Asaia bogorensis NBRC 16594]GBQ73867.1 hypothetical protein AA0311_0332 [Asaia bogorensis NBRC 16594]GEL53265.1 hypothetical protein ABO01nite_12720 [Asaia bogorensis NBRC 16594]